MILDGAFAAFRDDPSWLAVLDCSGSKSWNQLVAEISHVAATLDQGPAGEPVEIRLPSGRDFLTLFLASEQARRPACTLHNDWAGPELEAALAAVRSYRPETPPSEDPDPVFYIGFTSGTSGRPKPFARRSMSWISSFEPAGDLFSIEAGDMVYLPGSLQHSHFLFGAVLALNRGASARMFERFDAAALAEELSGVSRGVVYLVPTMLYALDELEVGPLPGVHSLVISGAKMEPHHWEIARRVFPRASANEIYGASELSFVTVNSGAADQSEPGYVGTPFPGVEIEIRPEGDETGLVYVRSPYLFDGYFDESGRQSPIGPDGFMTVGDVGVLGEAGLSIVGRASNMLITGGKNVHPEEVESRLVEHGSVRECVVAGVPDQRWGEELVAFVVAEDSGKGLEVEQLRDHLRGSIAAHKIPKRWFLVEEIPRTPAGKTDRSRDRLFEAAVEIC